MGRHKKKKVWSGYKFTKLDDRRQVVEKKKIARVTQKEVLAGSIPDLSETISYARKKLMETPEFLAIKNDNARIQKLLAMQSMAIADYIVKLYEALPATDKTAKKFNGYFMKAYKAIAEEARKSIDSANEIEYGKKLTIDKKGKFEDALEAVEVESSEGEIVNGNDRGGKEKPE